MRQSGERQKLRTQIKRGVSISRTGVGGACRAALRIESEKDRCAGGFIGKGGLAHAPCTVGLVGWVRAKVILEPGHIFRFDTELAFGAQHGRAEIARKRWAKTRDAVLDGCDVAIAGRKR